MMAVDSSHITVRSSVRAPSKDDPEMENQQNKRDEMISGFTQGLIGLLTNMLVLGSFYSQSSVVSLHGTT